MPYPVGTILTLLDTMRKFGTNNPARLRRSGWMPVLSDSGELIAFRFVLTINAHKH